MIEAAGLGRRFGEVAAVDDVSLRVPAGKILALLGPNGAGKTTIVRMLTGVLAMTTGRATVAGYEVGRDPAAVRARIGLVTDVPGLHEQMTVPSYLDFFGSVYGLPRRERAHRIDELLGFFDLQAHRGERMVGFSKGMKQKVALARALLHEPVALFLDEPTSGLDPLGARAVRELIVGMKQANRGIILCTHDLDEADRLADEIVILRQGRVVARGEPSRLRSLGSPETAVRIVLAEPYPGALAVLRALDGVLAPVEDTAVPGDPPTTVVAYRTRQPLAVNPRAIAALVATGARVVSVTCTVRSLEEVYAAVMAADEGWEAKSD
ncbi:MAG TPA: ABC transporter ATP-binding protein [Chloroflexota bacterium]|nr:ABC transporter ATP-binding protein [Chloroflexota bacterium]